MLGLVFSVLVLGFKVVLELYVRRFFSKLRFWGTGFWVLSLRKKPPKTTLRKLEKVLDSQTKFLKNEKLMKIFFISFHQISSVFISFFQCFGCFKKFVCEFRFSQFGF